VIKGLVAGTYKGVWGRDAEGLTVDPVKKVSVFWGITDYVVCFRTTERTRNNIYSLGPNGRINGQKHKPGDAYRRMSSVVILRKYRHGWGTSTYHRVVDSRSNQYDPLNNTAKLGRIKTTDLCPKSTRI
jgi:hypothetical protein